MSRGQGLSCSNMKARNNINCQTGEKHHSNLLVMWRHPLLDLSVLLDNNVGPRLKQSQSRHNLFPFYDCLIFVWGACCGARGSVTGIRTTPACPLRGSVNICSYAANCLCRFASAFWITLQQCCSYHRLLFASGSDEREGQLYLWGFNEHII